MAQELEMPQPPAESEPAPQSQPPEQPEPALEPQSQPPEQPEPAPQSQPPEQPEPALEPQSQPPEQPAAPPPTSSSSSAMRRIYLEKVVLNMGVGRSGDAIETAKRALDQITGKRSCERSARESQRDWGVRKGEPIGAAVTVRGSDARALLKRLFEAKGNTVNGRSFDNFGNHSFGIAEHIDIPGVKYEPQIGILGLGVSVALARPGYGIRKRSKHKARIGKSHVITNREAKDYLVKEFGVTVE